MNLEQFEQRVAEIYRACEQTSGLCLFPSKRVLNVPYGHVVLRKCADRKRSSHGLGAFVAATKFSAVVQGLGAVHQ